MPELKSPQWVEGWPCPRQTGLNDDQRDLGCKFGKWLSYFGGIDIAL